MRARRVILADRAPRSLTDRWGIHGSQVGKSVRVPAMHGHPLHGIADEINLPACRVCACRQARPPVLCCCLSSHAEHVDATLAHCNLLLHPLALAVEFGVLLVEVLVEHSHAHALE